MPNVLMGFYFYPRGGSAQVARSLCRALASTGWEPRLLSGSLGGADEQSNARCFFGDLPCRSLDYTASWSAFVEGSDPTAAAVPMHGSYERKPDVPDRVFFDLDDDTFDRQVDNWVRLLSDSAETAPDIAHLHHLTPIHEAIRQVWPDVPVLTHLHGTELKMLALAHGPDSADVVGPYTKRWIERMRRWAAESAHVIVVSDQDAGLVEQLLPVDAGRVTVLPNGVDIDLFSPVRRGVAERLRQWRRWLVDEPSGWRPGADEGSVAYDADDLTGFTDDDGEPVPVVVFAGRFMIFKRVQQLIEAHHTMRSTSGHRSVLVIVGGFPGEWEGEHPFDTVQRLGARDVFLMGWRTHTELAEILGCCDVFGSPAVDEPFGLVYLEAMSAGLPALATTTGGPVSFINVDPDRPTGWLVAPDDVPAIAGALTEAVSDRQLRTERGRNASAFVRSQYSWSAAATAIAGLYERHRS